MQLIRKILKRNLANIAATRDIVLSITDSMELFVNNTNGEQLKISDIVVCESKEAVNTLENKISGKFYYAKKESDLGLYVNDVDGITYMKEDVLTRLEGITSSIESLNQSVDGLSTSMTESISEVNRTITALSESTTQSVNTLNEAVRTIQDSINTLTSNFSNLSNDVTNVSTRVTALEQAKTANDRNIEQINTSIETINGSLETITTSISGITSSISALTDRMTVVENNVKTNTDNIAANTLAINNIKTAVNTKKFNSIYDIENLKKTKIEPEIFIPAYIFENNDEMFITKLKLRTRTLALEDITFKITYMAINSDGSVADETDFLEITLPANHYEVNRDITNTFKKGTGLTNGYLNVYVKDAPIDHPEATLMVSLDVRAGIEEETV